MANQPQEMESFPALAPPLQLMGLIGPSYGVENKSMGAGAVNNQAILSSARSVKAIVGPTSGPDIDFTDIQTAIDAVYGIGGGIVLLKSGRHYPKADLRMRNRVTLMGEGIGQTIIDFSSAVYSTASISGTGFDVGSIRATEVYRPVWNEVLTFTNNSSAVSASGAQLLTAGIEPGDKILSPYGIYTVKSVTDASNMVITEVYRGASVTNLTGNRITPGIFNVYVSNLTITNGLYGSGIVFDNAIFFGVSDVEVISMDRAKQATPSGAAAGIYVYSGVNFNFSNNRISDLVDSATVLLHGIGAGGYARGGVISNNHISGVENNGIDLTGNELIAKENYIRGCGVGVALVGFNNQVLSNLAEGCNGNGISMDGGSAGGIVKGNQIIDNASTGIGSGGDRHTIVGNYVRILASQKGIEAGSAAGDINWTVSDNVVDGNSLASTIGVSVGGADMIIGNNNIYGCAVKISDSGTRTNKQPFYLTAYDFGFSNTTTETTIFEKTVPAGTLGLSGGIHLHINAYQSNNTGLARTLTYRLYWGGTLYYTCSFYGGGVVNGIGHNKLDSWIQSHDNASVQSEFTTVSTDHPGGLGNAYDETEYNLIHQCQGMGDVAKDSNADQNLKVTVQMSNASPNITYAMDSMFIESCN